jgi:hypothetical protein
MNKITTLLFLISASMLLAAEAGDRPVNGVYTGWEPLPEMRGEDKSKWFRLHRLTVKGKDVELFGAPVAIKGDELLYSASEGGFLVYKGKLYEQDGKVRIKFTAVTEDDEGEELETYGGTLAKEDLAILVIDRVSFKMGGIVYTLQDRAPEPKGTNKAQK